MSQHGIRNEAGRPTAKGHHVSYTKEPRSKSSYKAHLERGDDVPDPAPTSSTTAGDSHHHHPLASQEEPEHNTAGISDWHGGDEETGVKPPRRPTLFSRTFTQQFRSAGAAPAGGVEFGSLSQRDKQVVAKKGPVSYAMSMELKNRELHPPPHEQVYCRPNLHI